MIDSHCHLVDEKYSPEEIGHVIERARVSGVEKFISAGIGFEHTRETLEVAKKDSGIFVAAGLGYEGDIDVRLGELIKDKNVVAIGECGLDQQNVCEELFAFHIQLAEESSLPLVVHCRNMFEQVYEMVKNKQAVGMMHCFTGDIEWMKKFVDLGWYISFGGIVTFKKSNELRDVLKHVPQERILVETDSPYLSPEPMRSERNEPKNLNWVVEKIAEVRNQPVEQVAGYTNQNAVRLFGL